MYSLKSSDGDVIIHANGINTLLSSHVDNVFFIGRKFHFSIEQPKNLNQVERGMKKS